MGGLPFHLKEALLKNLSGGGYCLFISLKKGALREDLHELSDAESCAGWAGLLWQMSILHRGVRAGPQCQGWHGRVCVLSWKHYSDIRLEET